MTFPEHDQMVDAFPSDRADQSLGVAVLPGRSWRSWLVANAHGAQPTYDCGTIDPVLTADHVAWGLIPREGFGDLLRDPFRRWVSGDINPDKLPPIQPDNHQNDELMPMQ
jgi:hypothetical protein